MYPKTWICPNCKKKWLINRHSLIVRDKDSLECDCGELIKKWNGAEMFTARLLDQTVQDKPIKLRRY